MLPDTHRIPLDTAHAILATFGITRPTKAYERWVKAYGFDVRDFGDVLFESPFIFAIDWRAWLQEELETIKMTLSQLGVNLGIDLDEEGEDGFVECEGRRAPVRYRPNDESDLDDVLCAIQSVVPGSVQFRASPFNEGSDTSEYAVLPRDEWQDLERVAPDVLAHYFCELKRSGT